MTESAAASADAPVGVVIEGPVAWVTLQRPERMNALSSALVDGLDGAFADLAQRADVSVVVLTGAGERSFCSGADLREREGMTQDEARQFLGRLRETFIRVEDAPQPVIAAINGYALGGGLELALCCDVRIAAASAALGLTEVRLGIIPGAGGTQRLRRAIGEAGARELVFSGRRLDAPTALARGVVTNVVPDAELHAAARTLAHEVALGAPLALRAAKQAMTAAWRRERDAALNDEQQAYAPLLQTADRLEALAAFREKRPPVFQGR
jgi:enoyl-CoA hydratase/carnithine racemase